MIHLSLKFLFINEKHESLNLLSCGKFRRYKKFQSDRSVFILSGFDASYFDLSYVKHVNRVTEKDFWLTIRFFVNPSVELTQRSVYSYLDFFRDIGGAAFMLFLLAGQINGIWTYNKLENILVS